MELLPPNENPVLVLQAAGPALQGAFNLETVLDAALLLDVRLSRKELLRMHRAWHHPDKDQEARDVAVRTDYSQGE